MRAIHVLFALAVSLVLSAPARTHTHVDPDGGIVAWYPRECCNDHDCRPIATIQRSKQGLWMTTVDGLTVLVGADQERRPSRDMRWHICLSEDVYHNVVINCLFEPPVAKGIGDKGKRIASP